MEDEVPDPSSDSHIFDYQALRTATVYLIDGSHKMFTERPLVESDSGTAFGIALECAFRSLKSQILGSPKDLFGILIYGVSPDLKPTIGTASQYPGVYVLVDLDNADVPSITAVDTVLKDPNYGGFKPKEGESSGTPLQLAESFWLASKLFENKGKVGDKLVLLFTASSEPDIPREQRKAAELRASDLMDGGARIEVIGLSRDFDFVPFYKDLVAAPGTEESENLWKPPDNLHTLDKLLTQVTTLSQSRRPRGKVDFIIGGDYKVSMGLYSLVREAYMPKKVKLDRKTNDILETVTAKYGAATQEEDLSADLLMRSDIVKYQEFGGARIRLRVDEHRSLRRMGAPGLTLLGFKPRSMIDLHWYHRPCDFLYPEETVVKGSRSFIAALIDRCKAQDKVAICRLIANTNSLPHMVALFPQDEVLDESGLQTAPPGFHAFYLPYADDVRDIDLAELQGGGDIFRANEEQIDVAKRLIRKLKQKGEYKPQLFQNPSLRKIWNNIESMALDEEPEEFTDTTVVPPELVEKRIGALAEEFNSLVEAQVPEGKKPYKKPHGFSSGTVTPAEKKRRVSGEGGATDAESILKNGKGAQLTVNQLKDYLNLSEVKYPARAKKQELVELAVQVASGVKTE